MKNAYGFFLGKTRYNRLENPEQDKDNLVNAQNGQVRSRVLVWIESYSA